MRLVVYAGFVTAILAFHSSILNASTRFLDSQKRPIDEIRIVGNREITTTEILDALEQGPDDFGTAVKVMRGLLPFFESVDWTARVQNETNVVTLRVREKPTRGSWLFGSQGRAAVTGGFNRVDGVRFGGRFDMWKQPDLRTPPRGRLFGRLTYGFANELWNYELGGVVSWGWLKEKNVTLTTRVYRLTDIRDADALPSDGEQFAQAFFFGDDFRDYYLRDGGEFGARWQREVTGAVLDVTYRDEEHDSLLKSSDWSLFDRDALKEPNYPAVAGRLRSVVARYEEDFGRDAEDRRSGWHYTFEVEQSFPSEKRDFDFTRGVAHVKLFRRVGDFRMATRVKGVVASDGAPLQRWLLLGGPGSLRGFDRNEFGGAVGWFANVELSRWKVFGFVDTGQVAANLSTLGGSETHTNVGFGVRFGDGFRIYVARALATGRKPVAGMRWSRSF